jgi:hypothetical protein
MQRVLGIGGVFFKSRDPAALVGYATGVTPFPANAPPPLHPRVRMLPGSGFSLRMKTRRPNGPLIGP